MKRIYLLATFSLGVCASLVVLPSPVSAFCIYNKTDQVLRVEQQSGNRVFAGFSQGYSGDINPGAEGCVNWRESGVNEAGRRDADLGFYIFTGRGRSKFRAACRLADGTIRVAQDDDPVIVKAGGWLEIRGERGTQENPFECVSGLEPE